MKRQRSWTRFAVHRVASLAGVLVFLLIATFLMIQMLPGDPAVYVAGDNATQAEIEEIRETLGLGDPVLVRFWSYVADLASGDLGVSFQSRRPVGEIIADRLPPTVLLTTFSLVLILILSTLIGIVAATLTQGNRRRPVELGFTAVTSIVGSLPEFLLATLLAFVFAVQLRLLPAAGGAGLEGMILPAAAISLGSIAILARIVRVETLSVLSEEYISTARSKRLSPWLIYVRHVIPNVLRASLTIGGLVFVSLVGGAVVVENVFARPGLGTSLVEAVLDRDYPLIQGIVLVLGACVVVVNALIDTLLAVVNPGADTVEG